MSNYQSVPHLRIHSSSDRFMLEACTCRGCKHPICHLHHHFGTSIHLSNDLWEISAKTCVFHQIWVQWLFSVKMGRANCGKCVCIMHIYLFIYLSVCLYIHPSIYPSINSSLFLSLSLYIWKKTHSKTNNRNTHSHQWLVGSCYGHPPVAWRCPPRWQPHSETSPVPILRSSLLPWL